MVRPLPLQALLFVTFYFHLAQYTNDSCELGWHVDQAILSEECRVVCIRFGKDCDGECMEMDEHLYKIVDKVRNFAVVYVVDNTGIFSLAGLGAPLVF